MKNVNKIQTFDGVFHDNTKDAMRHLDKLYGDVLTKIAHQLTACDGKYIRISEYLDENLTSFDGLLRIKRDMQLEIDDEEED